MALGRFSFRSRMLALVAAAGVAACQEAQEGASADQAAQSILGGQSDAEHRHVFILLSHVGRTVSSCTATLIAPNLLLTARHCVSASEDEVVVCGRSGLGETYSADRLRASNAVNVQESMRWFRGATVHVPEEGNDTCGYDVALITLTENVPASVAEPAIPRIDRDVEHGEPYVAVGYGQTELGEYGGRQSRKGLFVACAPGTCGRVARNGEFVGDQGVCEGDSGGPAFDADGKLVGIVSRGGEGCSVPVYGTVTTWKELIRKVAQRAALRGKYPAPFWVTLGTSVPIEDASPLACATDRDCPSGLICDPGDDRSAPACVPGAFGADEEPLGPEVTCSYGRSRSSTLIALGWLGLLVCLRSRRRTNS